MGGASVSASSHDHDVSSHRPIDSNTFTLILAKPRICSSTHLAALAQIVKILGIGTLDLSKALPEVAAQLNAVPPQRNLVADAIECSLKVDMSC